MKSFYFLKGKTISKEKFDSIMRINDETIEAIFINKGKVSKITKDEHINFPMPNICSTENEVYVEMPEFYDFYSINFLSTEAGKKLRIYTKYGYKTYDLRIKNDPVKIFDEANGIITFK